MLNSTYGYNSSSSFRCVPPPAAPYHHQRSERVHHSARDGYGAHRYASWALDSSSSIKYSIEYNNNYTYGRYNVIPWSVE